MSFSTQESKNFILMHNPSQRRCNEIASPFYFQKYIFRNVAIGIGLIVKKAAEPCISSMRSIVYHPPQAVYRMAYHHGKAVYIINAKPYISRREQVLAAARSHFGSNSPPDCYSLPKCRFTTRCGSVTSGI